jgi:hypothetical protein
VILEAMVRFRALFIFAAFSLIPALCFAQSAQPTTQPATQPAADANTDPAAALQAAKDQAKATFDQSSDGQALLQQIAAAEKGMDDARATGNQMEISYAATDELTVKSAYVRSLNAAYAADPGVQAAQAAVARAAAMPDLNIQILKFATDHEGQQVGDGQCWTLADDAMKSAHTTHPGLYVWGRPLKPNETVFPGDIIQFTSVHLQNGTWWVNLGDPNHTAIVSQVLSSGVYIVLHQNFGKPGKTVSELKIDLNQKTAGEYVIYRPGPDAGAGSSK